jgi:hypothetical protein
MIDPQWLAAAGDTGPNISPAPQRYHRGNRRLSATSRIQACFAEMRLAKHVSAAFAIVKELAGICGHLLGGFMTAFRASYDRNFKHLIQLCRQRSAGQRWRVMKRLISSGDEKTMDARSPIIPALTIAGDLYSGLPRQFLVA